MANDFNESAIFPEDISNGSVGGPMFLTFVQNMQSAFEQRLAVWPYGRYMYDLQYAIKTPEQSVALLNFFNASKAKTIGFRFLDPMDNKSCDVLDTVAQDDQTIIASAAGGETTFQLLKAYTIGNETTYRPIRKPIDNGSLLVEKNSVLLADPADYTMDFTTGLGTLAVGLSITDEIKAGFEYHVPCRFAIDRLPMTIRGPLITDTSMPIIEIRT